MEIIESVYAYLYKNNYEGETEMMEGVYTLSGGATDSEAEAVLNAHRRHGSPELISLDKVGGASLESPTTEPDFTAPAYSYIPASDGKKAMLSRVSLRNAIKDRTDLRGHKELTHAVFMKIPKDKYAADCVFCGALDTITDIEIENSGDGYVCEKKPETLALLDGDSFTSSALTDGELQKAGKQKAAWLLSAIVSAQCERKPLYTVGKPQSLLNINELLRTALKLLPSHIANGISFITRCNGNAGVKRDIVCVPTTDKKLISKLRDRGAVFNIDDTAFSLNSKYAALFLKCESVQSFNDTVNKYFAGVKSLGELENVATEYDIDAKIAERLSPRKKEKTLEAERISFVVRELILLDGKTINSLIKSHIPPSVALSAWKSNGLNPKAPHKTRDVNRYVTAAEQAVRAYLTSDEASAKAKSEFCAAVKRERDKKNVDFRIKVADASKRVVQSVGSAAVSFFVVLIASIMLFEYYGGGYFAILYFSFPFAAALVSQILFWYNARENKIHGPFRTTVWQTLTVCAVMLLCYFSVHAVLSALV